MIIWGAILGLKNAEKNHTGLLIVIHGKKVPTYTNYNFVCVKYSETTTVFILHTWMMSVYTLYNIGTYWIYYADTAEVGIFAGFPWNKSSPPLCWGLGTFSPGLSFNGIKHS